MEKKEEPLNLNNVNKQKAKKDEQKKKMRTYIIIAFVVFGIIFCCLSYYIYKNLTTLRELKKVLKKNQKELEDGDKTRIELQEKVDSMEKQMELKKRYIKEKKEIDNQKLDEYNIQKKICEDIEGQLNKIDEENQKSLILDEAINNLNNRIQSL